MEAGKYELRVGSLGVIGYGSFVHIGKTPSCEERKDTAGTNVPEARRDFYRSAFGGVTEIHQSAKAATSPPQKAFEAWRLLEGLSWDIKAESAHVATYNHGGFKDTVSDSSGLV